MHESVKRKETKKVRLLSSPQLNIHLIYVTSVVVIVDIRFLTQKVNIFMLIIIVIIYFNKQ